MLFPSEVLRLQAWALAKLYEAGDLTADEAVKQLSDYADRAGMSRATAASYFNLNLSEAVCVLLDEPEAVDG